MHRVRYECFLGTLVYYMNTWPHLGKRLTTFCEGPATFIDVDTCQGPKLVAGAGAAKSPIWWISTQQTYRPMNWVTVQSRRSQKRYWLLEYCIIYYLICPRYGPLPFSFLRPATSVANTSVPCSSSVDWVIGRYGGLDRNEHTPSKGWLYMIQLMVRLVIWAES